jgi:hypothetical protein
MRKLEKLYTSIPEDIRTKFKIQFDEDADKMSIEHPFWMFIAEGDVDFANDGGLLVGKYRVTLYLKNLTVLLYFNGDNQIIIHTKG